MVVLGGVAVSSERGTPVHGSRVGRRKGLYQGPLRVLGTPLASKVDGFVPPAQNVNLIIVCLMPALVRGAG